MTAAYCGHCSAGLSRTGSAPAPDHPVPGVTTTDSDLLRTRLVELVLLMRPDWTRRDVGNSLAVAETRWPLTRTAAEAIRIAADLEQTPAAIADAALRGQRSRRPLSTDRVTAHAAAVRTQIDHARPTRKDTDR